jgi:hypothetical protein
VLLTEAPKSSPLAGAAGGRPAAEAVVATALAEFAGPIALISDTASTAATVRAEPRGLYIEKPYVGVGLLRTYLSATGGRW